MPLTKGSSVVLNVQLSLFVMMRPISIFKRILTLQIQIHNSYTINGLEWEEAFNYEDVITTDFI